MDIVSGIAATTQAITIAKTLRGVEKIYDVATTKAQLADLLNALTDARMALADAKEGLSDRDKEIARLKASFADKGNLVKGRGDYSYIADAEGRPVGYPICPKCHVVDGRNVQLKQDGGIIKARCPVCASSFSPVTCYTSHSEAGPRTAEDEDKVRREAESARMHAQLRRVASQIA